MSSFVWIITSGYFLIFPKRVANSVRFYRALFPGRSFFHCIWYSWKQYHSFATVFIDRLKFYREEKIDYISEGWENIAHTAKQGKNGILLMTHMGNWEATARIFKDHGIKLLLYMGKKEKEQVESLIKESLIRYGLNIIAATSSEAFPMNALEGIRFLKEEGFISMAGDRLWKNGQKCISLPFLGHTVSLPRAPFDFALVTGAPIFVFFSFRLCKTKYQFIAYPPIYMSAESRSRRNEALCEAAQKYLALVEKMLRAYPFQWYHFDAFLEHQVNNR
jgi:lauroyl/myristoyl acyltransferase